MILKQIISKKGDLERLISDIEASLMAFDFEKILRDGIYNNHRDLLIFSDFYERGNESAAAYYLSVKGSEKERRITIAKCHLYLSNVAEEKSARLLKLISSPDAYIE